MSLGARIRRAFGPHERRVAELYRAVFVDLDALAERIALWAEPAEILEIGCGEGALAERLVARFPEAAYLGIDVIPHLGRLYAGPPGRAEFRQVTAEALAEARPGGFDLVVLADVLHHVPPPLRRSVLAAGRDLLAPGGRLVLKDWVRRPTPIHAATWVADVWIGGDRNTRYMTLAEQRALIAESFGPGAILAEAAIRPWRQNLAFLLARPGAAG